MPRAVGQTASLTSTSEVPVNGTTYTEQTSGAQRSLVSSSASDAAAGTGAQEVKITYMTLASDGTIAGPFSEVVSLNGTSAVATVATNIALIERLEVVAVGSGGASVGTISLKAVSDGSGATIASIAAGDPRAWLCHHYVPTGKRCMVTDVGLIGGNATPAVFIVKVQPYSTSSGPEQPVSGHLAAATGGLAMDFEDWQHSPVAGPARLRLYVAPGNNTAQVEYGSFGYVDQ